jgi:hypothetical protein
LLAFIVAAIGAAVLIASFPDWHQFIGPGSTELRIDEPGQYYLWNDHEIVFQGKSYDRSEILPNGLNITVTDTSTDTELPLVPDSSTTMETAGSRRNTVGYFSVAAPTTVRVSIEGASPARVFSVCESFLFPFMLGLLGTIAAFGSLLLAGVLVLVLGIVRLARSKAAAPPQTASPFGN